MLIAAVALLLITFVFAEELQKSTSPYELNFTNSSVFQQYKNYGALYNTSHLFLNLNLTKEDKLFTNVSISFGNGIVRKMEREGFTLAPSGADLERDLKDINETGRKYLLELAYEKNIKNLTVSVGLLDSTRYVDTNNYANDEHTQFLNDALINNPVVPLPSYNFGAHLHYQFSEKATFTILYINNKPDSGNAGIVQLEISGENFNLRPYYSYVFGGNSKGFGVSGDISPLERLGLFFRLGRGDSKDFVSIGFELKNLLSKDKLGLGYAYLKGEGTHAVAELYYSLEILKYFTVSFDLQYLSEHKNALVYGVRLHFKR